MFFKIDTVGIVPFWDLCDGLQRAKLDRIESIHAGGLAVWEPGPLKRRKEGICKTIPFPNEVGGRRCNVEIGVS
jgi:hypothetical protein